MDDALQQLNCFEGKRCRFDIFHFIGLCFFRHCDIIVFAAGEDDEVQQASGSWLCWLQFHAKTVRWGQMDIEVELTLNTRGPHCTIILPWLCS